MTHEDFGLVMPFLPVTSKGGPYEDDAYCGGWEAGALDARLQYERPPLLNVTVRTPNTDQLDLVAMHRGYRLTAEPWEDDDSWTLATFTRLDVAEGATT